MKYLEEYRDPVLAGRLLDRVAIVAGRVGRPVTIMEVCGSHTQAIGRYGIRRLMPPGIRLISGPGCPVCVTSACDVDRALWLAGREGVLFATFGDMMRVPGTGGASLQRLRGAGADVRVVSSAMDCIVLAQGEPRREVVFMGIGFETTAPTIASMVRSARRCGIPNLSVFSAHKIVPPALRLLVADPRINLDGFLCPGHVSIMLGSAAYGFIAEAGKAAVITGFEPVDVIEGILMLLEQLASRRPAVAIQYRRVVRPEGNPRAMAVMAEVFEIRDAEWRGLGLIPKSGLFFCREYETFDAERRFAIPEFHSQDNPGCSCGTVLRGLMDPEACPLFRQLCTPTNPVGPCMVSSEGTCSARYRYG
jgi:hydrogenase expression/formation protein HypD